jgi:hypothetical protein
LFTQCIGVALAAPCLFLVGFMASGAMLIAGLALFGLGGVFQIAALLLLVSVVALSRIQVERDA